MLVDDEEHEAASEHLHLLEKTGKKSFYGKWASSKLKKSQSAE
jgi:hypothetical protein